MLIVRYGDIVIVSRLLDPNGRNPKDHPAVVVTSLGEADLQSLIEVAAITTLIPDPLPDDHILLPWHLPRHPRTGLNKKGAVVGTWLTEISQDRVLRYIGHVPGRQLLELVALLDRLS